MRLLASGGELFGRGGGKDSKGRQGRMRRGGSRKGGGGHGKRRGSVVYEWAEGGGIDLIRRQGLMDKAGAVRNPGKPQSLPIVYFLNILAPGFILSTLVSTLVPEFHPSPKPPFTALHPKIPRNPNRV
jgi:hypothetical protein